MARPVLSKAKQKEIAKQRIINLFEQAQLRFKTNPSLSNRYITLARKLAMKVKIRIPQELKRRFCKHCYKYLQPGANARIRTREGKVIISCLECKKFTRIPIKNKQPKKN
jgi:ribonuclease P protein subunit RPR2